MTRKKDAFRKRERTTYLKEVKRLLRIAPEVTEYDDFLLYWKRIGASTKEVCDKFKLRWGVK